MAWLIFTTNSSILYNTSLSNIYIWLDSKEFIRCVTIPDDAQVCIYKNKFKANKIIVGPRIEIQDSDIWLNEEVKKVYYTPIWQCNKMVMLFDILQTQMKRCKN